jgi:hypothetical protein
VGQGYAVAGLGDGCLDRGDQAATGEAVEGPSAFPLGDHAVHVAEASVVAAS